MDERDALVHIRRSGQWETLGQQLVEAVNLREQRLETAKLLDHLDADRDNEDHVTVAVKDRPEAEHIVEDATVLAIVEKSDLRRKSWRNGSRR